jgi:hypothetical protein
MEQLFGRVEHVTSGTSARFEDVEALVDFFRSVLVRSEDAEK